MPNLVRRAGLLIASALVALGAAVLVASPASSSAFPGRNGALAFTVDDEIDPGQQVTSGEVGLLAPDGTASTLTTTPEGYWSYRPNWSADGTRVVYLSDVEGDVDPDDPRYHLNDVWVVGADGANPVNLTNTPDIDEELPTWSPDGRRISFSRYAEDGEARVWTMAADGSDQVQITFEDTVNQAWSPLGDRILVLVIDQIDPSTSTIDLATVAPDGGVLQPLTDDGQSYRGSWSPDGAQVLFTRGQESGDLWVMAADGTGARELLGTPVDEDWGAWSPDGAVIAFSRPGEEGTYELASIPAAGGEPSVLYRSRGVNLSAPNWQPLPPVPAPVDPVDPVARPAFTG